MLGLLPMGWGAAIHGWTVFLRAAGRAETTIETRISHIGHLGRAMRCGPWEVTGADLLAWTGGQTWARETRRSVRASVRGFYRWGMEAGLISEDPSTVLPAVTPGAPRPRPAPDEVYRRALAEADPRTRLILRLAGEAGLRRAEIAVIHSEDLQEDLVGWSLMVHGKGAKVRVVPLPTHLGLELVHAGPGWVFPGEAGGHLSPRWVGKLAARALPDGWTLHTLRHRFATAAYSVERDLLAVQQLLGHSSPATTQRYVAVDPGRLRRAMAGAA